MCVETMRRSSLGMMSRWLPLLWLLPGHEACVELEFRF